MKKSLILISLVFAFTQLKAQVLNDTTYIYRSLASALENPDKVFRLNLSKKQLKEFPEDIFKFKR